jgi:endonuclease III
MARESAAKLKERAGKIIRLLHTMYPDANCTLDHANPLQLLVATMLSAQCTDKRVNLVTPGLFKKYPSARAFAGADLEQLMADIRSTGFYRNKAKAIQAASRDIVGKFAGKVPGTMDGLTGLAGVGRKTANVILGNAFGLAVGVVVDTHVGRLAGRLGLTGNKDPEKVEQDLMALFAREDWIYLAHGLILHGRNVCEAKKPDCEHCRLAALCPAAFTFPHNRK